MTEADISMLRCDDIEVDDKNNTDTENVIQSYNLLPTLSSLTFEFHGINTWRPGGKLPVGRAKLKTTPIPRIKHM